MSVTAPARTPAAFVAAVRALADTDDWLMGDVDTAALLDDALAQLARTGAHAQQITDLDARRAAASTATLTLEAVTLLADALALRTALGRRPLARSKVLAAGVPVAGPDATDVHLALRAPVPGHELRQRVTVRLARGGVLLLAAGRPLILATAMDALDAIAAGTGLARAGAMADLVAVSHALADVPHISTP
ncbi:hypothetical protein [Cellulosimicrobium sp. Marseille-Q4280]|uniref:hypothetical protein n=1 Tax=Cellulosimicrobium sp. Marseille-Q4280 TaxID=2937992 RepID=UPI00203FA072|nr:hypothetical protein [Cellulosimicrobium sp. Marseille-Q4280]